MATKEDKYTAAMQALGTYDPAFDAEIHDLAILERELSRVRAAWKATAPKKEHPSVLDPLYPVITSLQRDILAHRDALGLTPKGLRRLKSGGIAPEVNAAPDARAGSPAVALLMDTLRAQAENAAAENAPVSNLDHSAGDPA